MSERTERLESIFHDAAELSSAAQRAKYLDAACEGDPALRCEVEALLKAALVAEDMFQVCEQARLPDSNDPAVADVGLIGSSVGPYKLLEIIGEGGMGVVYMAEQDQPVRRKVALKIIKLGMDTKQVVARFEAERQALAMMDHPHIAKVLGGGATETGRPYFVMELVQGVPITEFCRANRLSVADRLKLFTLVCQAIQSAHQKGIIHRDIKPSNVLVTLHNDAPHPMVIDFGVARAIHRKLTDKTLFTNFATMIGTPAYMSPEQAEMSKLDIDTRSDIYSLGVLLYELLTGTTPFPEERLRRVPYGEMQRIIAEEEPERPSTRFRKKAAARPEFLNPKSSIDSDLDWIVMKCLEKDRNRRYETATDLAADLRRYVANEPVGARPPSAAYRFQKLVRRNRLQFATGTFALMALVVAVAVSSWQAVRAKSAERSAQAQAQNAEAIKDFLIRQLLAGNPYNNSQPDPGRRALVESVARDVDKEFAGRPEIEAELRIALGQAFFGLGDTATATTHLEKAFRIREKHLGPHHSDTLWALSGMAQGYLIIGRHADGVKLMAEALGRIKNPPERMSSGEAEVLWTYNYLLAEHNKPAAEVLPGLQQALAASKRTSPPKDYRLQNKLHYFAYLTTCAERWEEAEALFSEGIPECERIHGADSTLTIQFKKFQSYYFMQRGRWNQARTNLEQIIPIYHRVLGTNHANTLDAESLLAQVYDRDGRVDEATERFKSLFPRWAKDLPSPRARGHCGIIWAYFAKQRSYPDAQKVCEVLRESWETFPPANRHELERFIKVTAAAKGWPNAAEICLRNFDTFPESGWLWLTKAWVFRYVGDEDNYRRVVGRVLALAPTFTSTNEQHMPIEIAALGSFKFSVAEMQELDSMMSALETALPERSSDLRTKGYRAIALLQLRLERFDRCLAALDHPASRTEAEAYPLLIKAMCLYRLNRVLEAKVAFAQAEAIMTPAASALGSDAERFLPTWQIYQQLQMHRETQALLAPNSPGSTPGKSASESAP